MGEFFFEYGLFAAKSITILLSFVAVVLVIASSVASAKHKAKEFLDIEKVNDKYEDLKDELESEIYSKDEYKALCKARKKEEKEKQKEEKNKLKESVKSGKDFDEKDRLFILRFDGDMQASEVDFIRETISAVLQVAKKTDEILVILESPGGVVHGYGLAASQLRRIKDKGIKLTVAVDLVAASGGYMMACVADKIIAAPFAVVGSIGVLAQVPNFNRLLDKNYVDIEHHTAGEYKSTITMLGKVTNKDRAKFKEELEDTHQLFKKFVKENRNCVEIDKLATGEHWYGTQALELKLIDEIKTSDDYIIESCKDRDVFEVDYKIAETLKDKISSMVENSALKIINKLLLKFKTNKLNLM